MVSGVVTAPSTVIVHGPVVMAAAELAEICSLDLRVSNVKFSSAIQDSVIRCDPNKLAVWCKQTSMLLHFHASTVAAAAAELVGTWEATSLLDVNS